MSRLTPRSLGLARQQRVHILLSSALVILLAGCAAFRGVGATPEPTTTATPTAIPRATFTPRPTSTPAGTIAHPTGATDVVLRMEWGGGFIPMQAAATQMAQFTLYGDGTVVFKPLPATSGVDFNAPNPPFLTGHMTDQDIHELLAFALNDGGLANARTSYDFPGIADAGSTIFTVNADGVDKRVSVYALFESTNDGPDRADREALNKLQQRLNGFETEARGGAVDPISDYDPDVYKVMMFDASGGNTPAGVEPIAWPWKDILPSDFVAADQSAWAAKNLNRDQTAKLTDVPNGGQMSIWVKTPDGTLVDFSVRPLLPDESSTLPG